MAVLLFCLQAYKALLSNLASALCVCLATQLQFVTLTEDPSLGDELLPPS